MVKRTSIKFARNSNFELLRIIAMLMIICHHFVLHGLMRYDCSLPTFLVSQIFCSLGKIGLITFVTLSMWFIVDSQFKSGRFFRLFFETIFYTLILGICSYFLTNEKFTVWTWISLFFPISGASHNFISVYLVFYLFTPFLKIISEKVDKKQLYILVFILFWVQIVTTILFNLFGFNQQLSSKLILFSFVYFLMLLLKRYPIKLFDYKPLLLSMFIAIWALIYCFNAKYIIISDNPTLKKFINSLFIADGSILNVVGGVSLFFLFKFKKDHKWRIVNFIAQPTLGILLIHDNRFFRYYFWDNIVHVNNFSNSGGYIFLIIIGMSALIYVIAGCLDIIRKYGIENPIFKLKFIQNACSKIDCFIN